MNIFTIANAYTADQKSAENGVLGLVLMENAGQAIADAIMERWSKRPVAILSGPGNNGGDGFVVARLLKKAGWPVKVYLPVDKSSLSGDAFINAKRWRAKVASFEDAIEDLSQADNPQNLLLVDAVFGAGLSKPLQGPAKVLAQWLNHQRSIESCPVIVSVDMPSGVHGDLGHVLAGLAFKADLTVTFGCPKPGHFLYPGRAHRGELVVADIGFPDAALEGIKVQTFHNTPELWTDQFPLIDQQGHKYARGHLVVLGGDKMCGAARLAALAARRMGAGLVSIAVPDDAYSIYAASVHPGTLVPRFKDLKGFRKILSDPRKTTGVIGPGANLNKGTLKKVLAALKLDKDCVLDADALSIFEDESKTLFAALKKSAGDVVLTPHGGEFRRLFPDLAKKQNKLGKLEITRKAAKRAGCVVLYKGPDTIIAAPDGRAAISSNAPPTLATAGTGDVLAGFIGGLMAQNMPVFEAACAAAWLHGECANQFGLGLIAEDLADMLPVVLQNHAKLC
ncbi:MAG: bifunctional ADP-dependent NAD(P)H-hydrate dehydratase/NAD(P)H-hydrate epimerase [Rhodospirillaceae bacterium]|nr:MAG: bifunctional ADP-dependent NAD(P)H-hydrate dehydratase/NAD(P)H-hydrate epimerase [Rhodospirillaceae bacterium]